MMQLLMQLHPIIQDYYDLDENLEKFKELIVQFKTTEHRRELTGQANQNCLSYFILLDICPCIAAGSKRFEFNLNNRTWTREIRGLHIGRGRVNPVFGSEPDRTWACEL
jgi:hypothetical protein